MSDARTYTTCLFAKGRDYAGLVGREHTRAQTETTLANILLNVRADLDWATDVAGALVDLAPSEITLPDGDRVVVKPC